MSLEEEVYFYRRKDMLSTKKNPLQSAQTSPSFENYDVCFVFPTQSAESKTFKSDGLFAMERLISYFGKENIYAYYSVEQDEILVLVRITEEKMRAYAASNDMKFLADPKELESRAKQGWPQSDGLRAIRPLKMETDPSITRFSPYDHIFLAFQEGPEVEKLYLKANGTMFGGSIRKKIIYHVLNDDEESGCLNLELESNVLSTATPSGPLFLAAFPLHDLDELEALRITWFDWTHFLPWTQPLVEIRHYFGEKIALYYCFLGEIYACLYSA
jgi:hypothetical protein